MEAAALAEVLRKGICAAHRLGGIAEAVVTSAGRRR